MQNNNNKYPLKLSWLFYVNQFHLFDIVLSLLIIVSFINLFLSLPKTEPMDPNNPNNYPFKIIELGKFNYSFASTYDVDDDGNSEIIGFSNIKYDIEKNKINTIKICSLNGTEIEQFNFAGELTSPFAWFVDINQDGRREILFFETLYDSIFINIRSINDESIARVFVATKDVYTRKQYGWYCNVLFIGAEDVNDDKYLDLIVKVNAAESGSPRGIFAIDYKNDRIIWHHMTGAFITDCFLNNQNENVKKEICFGTMGSGNMRTLINGMNDFHTYFVTLNLYGKRILIEDFGYNRGMVVLIRNGDIDGNGRQECLVLHNIGWPEIAKKEESSLYLYQSFNHQLIKKWTIRKSFLDMSLSDINNDGKEEIILSSINGEIMVYSFENEKLKVLKTYLIPEPFQSMNSQVVLVEDMDNDGYKEIAINTSKWLLVCNNQFKIQAIHGDPGGQIDIVKDKTGLRKIIYSNKKQCFLMQLKSNKEYPLNKLNRYSTLFTMVMILLGMSLLLLIQRKHIKNEVIDSSKGFIRINRKNRITEINKKALEILRLDRNRFRKKLKEVIDEDNQYKIVNAMEKLDSESLDLIEDIINIKQGNSEKRLNIEILSKIKSNGRSREKILLISDIFTVDIHNHILNWGAIAQQLAHEIKNPLSAIILNIKRIQQMILTDIPQRSNKYEKNIKMISEEIERLRNSTNAFMKFTDVTRMKMQICDVNEVIVKLINKYILNKPPITLSLSEDLHKIRADHEMILRVLSSILSNSIEATQLDGEIQFKTINIERIDINTQRITRFIEIEIMDTGRGISEENINNIFKPGFTTKSGGAGFGLSIARHIIEEHKGEITIKSQDRSGTIVSIALPVEQ